MIKNSGDKKVRGGGAAKDSERDGERTREREREMHKCNANVQKKSKF